MKSTHHVKWHMVRKTLICAAQRIQNANIVKVHIPRLTTHLQQEHIINNFVWIEMYCLTFLSAIYRPTCWTCSHHVTANLLFMKSHLYKPPSAAAAAAKLANYNNGRPSLCSPWPYWLWWRWWWWECVGGKKKKVKKTNGRLHAEAHT